MFRALYTHGLSIKELMAVIIASSMILLDVAWADISYYVNEKGQLIQVEEKVILEEPDVKEVLDSNSSTDEKVQKASKKMKGKINFLALQKAVLERESSNNYKAINTYGFLGGFQFGIAMAEDVGMLKRGEYKRFLSMKVSQKKFFLKHAKWRKGLSAKKFLASSKLQNHYFQKSLRVNMRYLKHKGVITKHTPIHKVQGYLVAAHLKGASSVKLWTEGRLKNTTDRFGTDIEEYFHIGMNS